MSDFDLKQTPGVGSFPFDKVQPSPAPVMGSVAFGAGASAPADVVQKPPASPPQSWGLLDISALPEPERCEPATQVFHACGRDWPVTVDTGAAQDPDKLFELLTMLRPDQNSSGLTVVTDTGKFKLANAGYIGGLRVLSKVALMPRLTLDEWAEFGRKATATNKDMMGQIINFALSANRIGESDLKAEEKEAGESTGTEV